MAGGELCTAAGGNYSTAARARSSDVFALLIGWVTCDTEIDFTLLQFEYHSAQFTH